MSDSLGKQGKKIAILAKLARRTKIGMDYLPKEKVLGRIPKHARGDISTVLDEMYREGLIEYHKGKKCISINPNSVEKVTRMLEGEIPDYILDKLGYH